MSARLLPAMMLAFCLALAAPARATAPDADAPSGGGSSAEALQPPADDAELGNFVAALMRLVGVEHGYMMMLHGESDPDRVEELKMRAVRDMTAAVERDGMSLDRYNQIAVALRDDTDLQSRVEGILQQLAETPEASPPEASPGPTPFEQSPEPSPQAPREDGP